MEERFEIIDAFVDAEPVDPIALKRALSEPEGRDYLVDAWLLRNVVQDEMALEAASLARPAGSAGRRPWLIAAGIAGACLIGGYVAGTQFPGTTGPPPVEPPRVEVQTPAASASFPMPPATRVIRLELDPNVADTPGGR